MKSTISIICVLLTIFLVSPFQSCKKVEKVKHDVLEYSLNTLGEKLFSLIPDGDAKTNLQVIYDDFVQRAVDGDVEADQIEYVTANILNAANSKDTIQADLAKVIVEGTNSSFNLKPNIAKEASYNKSSMSFDQTRSIGENLDRVLKMNDQLKKSHTKNNPDEDFGDKVFYKFDKGIVMTLDENLKSVLGEEEYEELFVELNEMEKVQKMEWKSELSKSLKMEHMAFRDEMKKVKELKIKYQDWDGIEEFEVFSFDDSNFYAPYVPEVNLDSIMQALSKNLEAVGEMQKLIMIK